MTTNARFKLYSVPMPKEKSLVNFIFTEHCEDCLKCHLIDFDIDAIMPFQLATLKSTIKSINTLAPLNKPMIGTVEEINNGDIIVSMVYVDKNSDEYKEFEENNIKNKKLVSIVKRYATSNKLNYVEFWEQTIYPLDMKRTSSDDEFSLFDYILTNINSIHTSMQFISMLQQLTLSTTIPTTKFKMICQSNIINMKNIINMALTETNLKDHINITVESTPNYIIASKDTSIDTSKHIEFLKVLERLGKDPENLVKIMYD